MRGSHTPVHAPMDGGAEGNGEGEGAQVDNCSGGGSPSSAPAPAPASALCLSKLLAVAGPAACANSCPLYNPSDRDFSSDLMCLVRSQIELFVVTAETEAAAATAMATGEGSETKASRSDSGGSNGGSSGGSGVRMGRVGIRCRWCRGEDGGAAATIAAQPARVRGAVYYPKSIRLIYQAVRNWQRYHLLICPLLPEEIKSAYLSVKWRTRSSKACTAHWEESCRRMGLVDAADGIRVVCGRTLGRSPSSVGTTFTNASCSEAGAGVGAGASAMAVPRPSYVGTSADGWGTTIGNDSVDVAARGRGREGGAGNVRDAASVAAREQAERTQARALAAFLAAGPVAISTSDAPSAAASVARDMTVAAAKTATGAAAPEEDVHPAWALPSPRQDEELCRDGNGSGNSNGNGNGADISWFSPDSVLERVRLAHSIVQAIVEMRRFSPVVAVADEEEEDGIGSGDGDLTSLGVELYELFSGRHPFHNGKGAMTAGSTTAGSAVVVDDDDDDDNDDDEGGNNAVHDESAFSTVPSAALVAGYASGMRSSGSYLDGGENGQSSSRRKRRDRGRVDKGRGARYVSLGEMGLPSALCDLVSRLLDRNSADGYRSADEVAEDLRLMAEQPDRYLFAPSPAALDIPRGALFGREEELRLVRAAYDRTVASAARAGKKGGGGIVGCRSEVVVISGYSGTGKSTVAQHALSEFAARGARCVSGKFDAMRQVQPLGAVLVAVDEYCDCLSRIGEEEGLRATRQAIAGVVGGEGNVLVDLIPNLGKIIGRTMHEPSVPMGGREAQQRLMFLFRSLFRVTCSPSHPVVLFLDDMQWADVASLQLLRVLVTDDQIRGLLLMMTYRDNEVSAGHPLIVHLDEIKKSGRVSVTSVRVGNMDRESINNLVAHSLRMIPRSTRTLSEAVSHKTGGNAFFAVEFLASLVGSGLLRFSLGSRRWEWDLYGINAVDIAMDVVDFMTARMLQLAPEVHKALRVAAAFGVQCDERLLRMLDRALAEDRDGAIVPEGKPIAGLLDVAVSEGLMSRFGSTFRFSHDQIQSAAYHLIPESMREAYHLQIGRSLWKCSDADEMEAYLFVIVDQLHRGETLLKDRDEKVSLAYLCLLAGQKASGMSAFAPASVYLKAGIRLLSDEDWDHNRDLCLDLHNSCIETEFILADFGCMEKHLEQVLRRANNLQEKLRAYHTLVQSLGAQGNCSDAIDTGIKVLGHLGEVVVYSEEAVMKEIAATRELLENSSDEFILGLDTMEDPEKKEAMRFFNVITLYMFLDKYLFLRLVICRMVRLSLLYGLCRESAIAFANYGVVCCTAKEYRDAYRFGKLAISMFKQFQAKEFHARIHAAVDGYINGWIEPAQSCLPTLKNAVDVGMLTGDVEFAMVNAQVYLDAALIMGHTLGVLLAEAEIYSKQMLECRQIPMHKFATLVQQTALNLRGQSDATEFICGEVDGTLLDNVEEGGNLSFLNSWKLFRMWVAYLFQKHEIAAGIVEKEDIPVALPQYFFAHAFILYRGLIAFVMARKCDREKWQAIGEEAINQMEEWAELSAWNCQHKLDLLNAEYAYLKGDISHAAILYDSAVSAASNHRFIHEQAVALERAGIFYLEVGKQTTASGFFVKACDCYEQWGAYGKVKHIQECFL